MMLVVIHTLGANHCDRLIDFSDSHIENLGPLPDSCIEKLKSISEHYISKMPRYTLYKNLENIYSHSFSNATATIKLIYDAELTACNQEPGSIDFDSLQLQEQPMLLCYNGVDSHMSCDLSTLHEDVGFLGPTGLLADSINYLILQISDFVIGGFVDKASRRYLGRPCNVPDIEMVDPYYTYAKAFDSGLTSTLPGYSHALGRIRSNLSKQLSYLTAVYEVIKSINETVPNRPCDWVRFYDDGDDLIDWDLWLRS